MTAGFDLIDSRLESDFLSAFSTNMEHSATEQGKLVAVKSELGVSLWWGFPKYSCACGVDFLWVCDVSDGEW